MAFHKGKPAFVNIKDLTNGSSEITDVGRSQWMFLKTRCNPYKGFRSIHRKTTIVGSRFNKAAG